MEIQVGQGVLIVETFPGREGVVLEVPKGNYPYYLVFVTHGDMKGHTCYCLHHELLPTDLKVSIDQAKWLFDITA